MRLFAAIPIEGRVNIALARLQKGVADARWVPPNKLHITLGFFDDVSDDFAEVLDMELGRISAPAFDLQLSSVGHFGSNIPISLWAGVKESAHLSKLQNNVQRAARKSHTPMDMRTFLPHVTLAYLPKHMETGPIIAFKKAHMRFKSPRFLVDRFHLYSSVPHRKGPNTYRIEASYPLLAPEKQDRLAL